MFSTTRMAIRYAKNAEQRGGETMIRRVILGAWRNGFVMDSFRTAHQISKIQKRFECAVQHNGKTLTWDAFQSLFKCILKDREMRVEQGLLIASRPPFAVATIEGNKVVRFEFYQGHDTYELVYDLKSPDCPDLEPFLRQEMR